MKETWWETWGYRDEERLRILQRKKGWTIDVPRPVSLTRALAAGYWLFCVRKQRPAFWKSSAEQDKGLRGYWFRFPVEHQCLMMRLPLSERGKKIRQLLLSSVQCMCVSPPQMQECMKYLNLSRIHSISDFICIQSESLHEHNADGKGCQSRLNLKFISSGKHSADEPVVPVSIFRLITAPTIPRCVN